MPATTNKNNQRYFFMLSTYKGLLMATVVPFACSSMASGFINDSKGSLTLENYYFDRDYREGPGQSQPQEWAQGLVLDMRSGFTEGPVGFGVDALGQLGFKLDSGPGRSGIGLLSVDAETGEPGESYGKFDVLGKARLSKTQFELGTKQVLAPVARGMNVRLFPPLMRGAFLTSREIDDLTLQVTRIDAIKLRNSTNHEPMSISSPYRRFNGSATSDQFDILGVDYQWNAGLATSYYHATLQDLYRQDYISLLHTWALPQAKLVSDLRYFISREDGAGEAGPVDNRTFSSMFTLSTQGHSIGLGYMALSGATAMPYVAGTSPYVNTGGSQVSEFVNPGEKTWQFRYDYDFVALGVPGLKFMWRYMDGRQLKLPIAKFEAEESERDVELSYVIQSGSLRNLGIRLRNADYRADFTRDINETRVQIDYTLALW